MDGDTFSFISPKSFRDNIVQSVDFVAYLWTAAQSIETRYIDEMARTIILYNISVIEALLLYRARIQKLPFFKIDYKEPTAMPSQFQIEGKKIIFAFQEKVERSESQVWLHELIHGQKAFLGSNLHKNIKDLHDVRNTFHLAKNRSGITLKGAEKSFDVVLKLINKIRDEKVI